MQSAIPPRLLRSGSFQKNKKTKKRKNKKTKKLKKQTNPLSVATGILRRRIGRFAARVLSGATLCVVVD
ncbi:hypothetical protein [Acetobacter persici]|uniref:hypothetical protein n=1 Tax=Acetobacter persici TaxID=1076596 RepID=UPI0012FE4DBE|nr:hypothetical protein [Acetobacter persici]